MKLIRHTPNLFRLVRIMPVNCYLVREDDGFTLVDTSIPGRAAQIIAAVRTLDAPVRRIVLTHAHGDHVGSLDAICASLPGVEVIIGSREARLMAQDLSLDADEPQIKLRGGFPVLTTKPTRIVEHGDRVGSLQAVFSPGHTPGHMAFLDTRDGTLLAGDAWQTGAGVAVPIASLFPFVFPMPALFSWARPMTLASAIKLRDLNPTSLATGHGPVISSPRAAMNRAIERAKRIVG